MGVAGAVERVAADLPKVGVLFYRAHHASGNTDFAHALADAIDATGEAVGLPIFSSSLRSAPDDLYDALGTLDALVVTVLAAGGSQPATASAGGEDEAWDVERMAALDIPILQGLCLTSSREDWEASDDGVTPLDSATQIAIPEFDGRIITAPFSFKEIDEDGLPRYVADPERCARVAGIATKHARLRHVPTSERKIALMLSAYPTKHSRVGNAVGLDTPVSTVRLLRRMREQGYDLGAPGAIPGLDLDDDTEAGDALIHALIAAGGQDEEWLTNAQLTDAHVRIPAADYRRWTARPAGRADGRGDRGVGRGAGIAVRQRQQGDRAGHDHGRQRRAPDPAAARLRREPDRDLPRPRPGAVAPLPGGLPLARGGLRRATPSCTSASTGRWSGCPARTRRCRRPARPTPRSATCR